MGLLKHLRVMLLPTSGAVVDRLVEHGFTRGVGTLLRGAFAEGMNTMLGLGSSFEITYNGNSRTLLHGTLALSGQADPL